MQNDNVSAKIRNFFRESHVDLDDQGAILTGLRHLIDTTEDEDGVLDRVYTVLYHSKDVGFTNPWWINDESVSADDRRSGFGFRCPIHTDRFCWARLKLPGKGGSGVLEITSDCNADSIDLLQAAGFDERILYDDPQPLSDPVNLADLTDDPPPQAWVLAGLIPRGKVTLLAAHGGVGKSALALAWAAHVAHGLDWAGRAVEGSRALYVSFEDGEDVFARRAANIYRSLGVAHTDSLTVLDASLEDEVLALPVNKGGVRVAQPTPAMRRLEVVAQGYDLVVIDNARDAYPGDENSKTEVNSFVKGILGRMAARNNQAVLLLSHTSKASVRAGAENESYAGSSEWHNRARSRLALTPTKTCVALSQGKSNLGVKMATLMQLEWHDEGVLLPVIVDELADKQRDKEQLEADGASLLAVFKVAEEAGDWVTAAQAGPRTTYRQLSSYPEFPKIFKAARGRARFDKALTHLKREKAIVEAEVRDKYRNKKSALVIARGNEDD